VILKLERYIVVFINSTERTTGAGIDAILSFVENHYPAPSAPPLLQTSSSTVQVQVGLKPVYPQGDFFKAVTCDPLSPNSDEN